MKPFTSAYVIDELEQAPAEKREKMLSLLGEYNISVLTYSDEAKALADIYVSNGVIPSKYRTDGLHIAIAAERFGYDSQHEFPAYC